MKHIAIYQLPIENDNIFRDWDRVSNKFNFSDYDCVYDCSREDDYDAEDAFCEFNNNRPSDFCGHSLSVSDIVKIGEEYFYCDDFGWENISSKII